MIPQKRSPKMGFWNSQNGFQVENIESAAPPLTSTSKTSLACWLLLVVYPLLNSFGTIPVVLDLMSVELLFSLICVIVVLVEVVLGRLKILGCNMIFVSGLALWLVVNVVSSVINGIDSVNIVIFRMALKACFGFMTFLILMNSNKVKWLLWAYVTGCAICGLFAIVFVIQEGNLNSLQVMSYVSRDVENQGVNVIGGIARMGASNLLPLWVCIGLYLGENGGLRRKILIAWMPFFAILSLMALRREVLLESGVGLLVLIIAVPGKFRVMVCVAGVVLVGCIIAVIYTSVSWQDRLFQETRDQFESGTDPRTIMLLNTPVEMAASPLIGHGTTSYSERMSKYLNRSSELKQLGAHNSFSRAAVETGALGLLGFILMIVSLGWRVLLSSWTGHMSTDYLRVVCIMIFLHVGDWLFFGDGICSNICWYFIGVLLYLERCHSCRFIHEAEKPLPICWGKPVGAADSVSLLSRSSYFAKATMRKTEQNFPRSG